jgi:hypothetical protein
MKVYLEKVRCIRIERVPDGEYAGLWSGYRVSFETPYGQYEGTSTVGVRGMNIPCTVKVEQGQFTITAK